MSSIKLTADSNGGTFELKAPSSSSNTRVLTLPDTANGTVLTTTNPKPGNIIQIVSTTVTAASTGTLSTNGSATLLSRTYTPTFSSSNALIQVSVHVDIANQYGGMFINLNRDAQQVATGDAAGNRRRCTIVPDFSNSTFGGPLKSFTILDTDISGTSEVTYSVKMLDQSGNGGEYYLNTGRDNTDFNYILRSVSTLTVMEVAT